MQPIVLKFTWERETKNTQRFQEVVAPDAIPVIGTLYVAKATAGDRKELTVTIS